MGAPRPALSPGEDAGRDLRTSSTGTSLSIACAIVRGQDPAQRAGRVLLVGAEMVEHGLEIERERRHAQLEPVEQPLDPLGARLRRDPAGNPEPAAARSP